MKIHDVTQGSLEWHVLRSSHFTASEAPAMMGASKYMTRSELLRQKKTGLAPEVTPAKQALFDRGHAAEESARAILAEKIGEDLYPVTCTRGNLLASLDGMDMAEQVLFEHKLWNEDLAAQVLARELDPHYYWQLEQQLLVTGADKVIFVCSDGTEEHFVSMEYSAQPGRAEALVAGWEQFAADLEAQEAPAAKPVEKIGRAPEMLPAIHVEVTGMVKHSNLDQFRKLAMEAIGNINTDLQDDQDFADAEKTVKWCADVETRLAATKDHILGQAQDIDAVIRTLDEVNEEARQVRLRLEKLVKNRKQEIRDKIVQDANEAFRKHTADLEAGFGGKIRMPVVVIDVASAIKGKKTIASLRDAADTELARAKVEASTVATSINQNLATLREQAAGFEFLFHDAQQLLLKASEDLQAVIANRITEHKQAEQLRQDQERELIRQEELKKIEDEKLAEQQAAAQPAAPAVAQATAAAEPAAVQPVKQQAPADDGQRLKLGDINSTLGFTVTADFLRSLGFEPANRERNAVLYRASDWPRICAALVQHINSVATQKAAA
ncbi:YqaJ viral recombinase family protein [Pseudomonas sp. NPDC077649]|uniref:YqaJ viral recombinase family protein n=1 Tax=Pseudomonas sp. NPDC077649 TaxID=3364423 RepID=UPI0037CCBAEA